MLQHHGAFIGEPGGINNDDDDDDSYTYGSSDKDNYHNNNNNPNVIFDMQGNQFTIDDNENVVPYLDTPMTLQAAQRQINAILTGCTTASSIKEFTNQAELKHAEFFLPKNKNANHTLPTTPSPVPTTYTRNDHDAYLHRRWNRSNRNKNTTTISPSTTKPTPAAATTGKTIAYTPIEMVKDDLSVTPTLETLCTLDTRSSQSTNIDNDAILRITIWNQPIIQYRMPIRPFASHRSRRPSIAVRYALIGVYDKLLDPSELPCLLSFFTSIISVALSCFILLADSFTMVKIDDRFPDEWND